MSFVYQSSVAKTAEAALGALTWTGGVAPSGTITKTYSWMQYGGLVTAFFKITATVAGTAVTKVSFALPSDMPLPATFASQPNSTVIAAGTGSIEATGVLTTAAVGVASLVKDAGGNLLIEISCVALAASNAWATISYLS